jgi:hypothetical protein
MRLTIAIGDETSSEPILVASWILAGLPFARRMRITEVHEIRTDVYPDAHLERILS